MTTMLKVLTFLTLKGLTIGMVLLTVAYTYSIKKHHGHHHGHIAHAHYEPATVIKTSSHSFPHHHAHVPKYHSHYSSHHHPHHHHGHHHHHRPHGHRLHYAHKSKIHFTPPPHYHQHHDHDLPHHHHPEQIEIVKDIHVHSSKPHLYHKHVSPPPEIEHSYEVVKDGPVIEYPHKHVHSDYHSVKKRYPHSQPIVEYVNSNDNSYDKSPKKPHRPKSYDQSSGLQSLYDIQKDYSKYAANEEEYSNSQYKESEFSPVNQQRDYPPQSPPGYGSSVVSTYAGSAGDYGASQASYPPSNIATSYTDVNVGGAYSGGASGGYAGSNLAGSGYVSGVASGHGSNSVSGGYGSNSLAGGYAPSNLVSDYSGGVSQESYVNDAAAPAQSEVKNDYTSAYFTNHKDYLNINGNSEEFSKPVVNNQYDFRNTYSSADSIENVYSNQYQNNYATNQQDEYNRPSAPTYNTDSSYDNDNSFDLSTNEVKYSANTKYTPFAEQQNAFKSNSAPFVVNIPNIPEVSGDSSEEEKNSSEESSEEDPSSFEESMDSPTFESQKTTSYDSSIEGNSYNDQSNSQNNFGSSKDSTNSLSSDSKNESYESPNSQLRHTATNTDVKTTQDLEFEPAWAYILFNNQNNSTSSPLSSNALDRRMDVGPSHHSQMPVIKC